MPKLIDDRRPQLPVTNVFRFMQPEHIVLSGGEERGIVFRTAFEIEQERLKNKKK